jgi:hypothetical protein
MGYNIADKEAIGLVYSFDPGRLNELRIKYLSKNKDVVRLAKEYWDSPMDKLKPNMRSDKIGIDISFAPDNSGEPLMILLLILGAPGHGVYV